MTFGIEHLLRLSFERPAAAVFNVVVVYDDSAASRRGMEMFAALQGSASRGIGFHCDLWRFDLLSLPSVRDAATLAGMHAQLIVVSANADRSLPVGVRQWIEQSLDGRLPGSAALAASLHSEWGTPPAESPVRAVLEAVARRRSIDFLDSSPLGLDSTQLAVAAFASPLDQTSILAEEVLPRSSRPARWGINE